MISDAFTKRDEDELPLTDEHTEKYRTIGRYDVTKYEEKPFETEIGE